MFKKKDKNNLKVAKKEREEGVIKKRIHTPKEKVEKNKHIEFHKLQKRNKKARA